MKLYGEWRFCSTRLKPWRLIESNDNYRPPAALPLRREPAYTLNRRKGEIQSDCEKEKFF
jgi:hypothetical protein